MKVQADKAELALCATFATCATFSPSDSWPDFRIGIYADDTAQQEQHYKNFLYDPQQQCFTVSR